MSELTKAGRILGESKWIKDSLGAKRRHRSWEYIEAWYKYDVSTQKAHAIYLIEIEAE